MSKSLNSLYASLSTRFLVYVLRFSSFVPFGIMFLVYASGSSFHILVDHIFIYDYQGWKTYRGSKGVRLLVNFSNKTRRELEWQIDVKR